MKKTVQLYEGKAKKVFDTDTEGIVIVSYKDDATALDGLKRYYHGQRYHKQPHVKLPDAASGKRGHTYSFR